MKMKDKLQKVCEAFRIEGKFVGYEQIKAGNVNWTYKVTYRRAGGQAKQYIVQRVNTYAFRKPEQLMHNADLVTEHIRAKKQGQTALHYHHTQERKTFIYDEENCFWRLCNFIPSITYSETLDEKILRQTGAAFGEFQMLLSDFPATALYETIPNFHNTPKRLETLFADAEKDPCGRASEVREELAYIASVREEAERLTRMHQQGRLPIRVTHNDTKINNVLFDENTHEALAIVDLDTVMPGLVGHDFGDAIRFAANFVEEDCDEAEKAGVNLNVYWAFAEGFLKKTAATLTEAEVDTLGPSCFALACELATRFLDDYIVGDKYFKVKKPRHNLVRTRCQIALAKDIQRKMNAMSAIVRDCAQRYRG